MVKILKYNNNGDADIESITRSIDNGPNREIINQHFIKFVIHLFVGTTDTIKEAAFFHIIKPRFFTSRKGMVPRKTRRDACKNNIRENETKEDIVKQYRMEMTSDEQNELVYDNENHAANSTPLPDNAHLVGLGNRVDDGGGTAIVGAGNISCIKMAIKAVIACFINPDYAQKYNVNEFYNWLSTNPDEKHVGLPNNQGYLNTPTATEGFTAKEAITSWTKYRMNHIKTQVGLDSKVEELSAILQNITVDAAGKLGGVTGIGATLNALMAPLEDFRKGISNLHGAALKSYVDIHKQDGVSLYNEMRLENEELRYIIKKANQKTTPNRSLTQIRVDIQKTQCEVYTDIKEGKMWDAETQGGHANTLAKAFPLVLDFTERKTNNSGATDNVRTAIENAQAENKDLDPAGGGGGSDASKWGDATTAGGAVVNGVQLGDVKHAAAANDRRGVGNVYAWLTANRGLPAHVAGNDGWVDSGGGTSIPGHLAGTDPIIAYVNAFTTAADIKAEHANGDGGTIIAAQAYWAVAKAIIDAAHWPLVNGAFPIVETSANAETTFGSTNGAGRVQFETFDFNLLLKQRNEPLVGSGTRNYRQQSLTALPPKTNIQLIADLAVFRMASKIIDERKQYDAGDGIDEKEVFTLVNDMKTNQLATTFNGHITANQNINALAAVHYFIFYEAARAVNVSPGAQVPDQGTQETNFNNYQDLTSEAAVPGSTIPPALLAATQANAPAIPQAPNNSIKAATAAADKWVKIFRPQ